jgi:OOP family OmpA-OmpF porin
MKLNHRIFVSAAVTVGLAAPLAAGAAEVTAVAKESGPYVVGLLGYPSIDVKKSDWDAIVTQAFSAYQGTVTSSSLNKGEFRWGLNIGYQLSRYFAVEAGYLDLGESSGTAEGTVVSGGVATPASLQGSVKSSGFDGALVGFLPFGHGWAADARVGVYYGDTKIHVTASTATGSVSASESASKSTFLGGVGLYYTFDANYSLSLDYTYIDKVGDVSKLGGTAPVDLFSLGFRYTW